jgi:hypothetical protein
MKLNSNFHFASLGILAVGVIIALPGTFSSMLSFRLDSSQIFTNPVTLAVQAENTKKIAELCTSKGVKLEYVKNYSNGLIQAKLPQGGYLLSEMYRNGRRSINYNTNISAGSSILFISEGYKLVNCGQIKLSQLKSQSVSFDQLDPKKFSYTSTETKDNPNSYFIQAKYVKPTMACVAFIDGSPPVIASINGGGSGVVFSSIDQVKIAWFDLEE